MAVQDGPRRHYPVFLDLSGRLAVVIGEGEAAERRAMRLARAGADVTVIMRDPSQALVDAEADGLLIVESRDYVRGDLAGASLVLCMSDDEEVRAAVALEARQERSLLFVSGDPELSSVLLPSVVRRGPLEIAVGTGGLAPELARAVRRRIAEVFDEVWAEYATLVARARALAAERGSSAAALSAFTEALVASDLLARVRDDRAPTAEALLDEFGDVLKAEQPAEQPPQAEEPDEPAADAEERA